MAATSRSSSPRNRAPRRPTARSIGRCSAAPGRSCGAPGAGSAAPPAQHSARSAAWSQARAARLAWSCRPGATARRFVTGPTHGVGQAAHQASQRRASRGRHRWQTTRSQRNPDGRRNRCGIMPRCQTRSASPSRIPCLASMTPGSHGRNGAARSTAAATGSPAPGTWSGTALPSIPGWAATYQLHRPYPNQRQRVVYAGELTLPLSWWRRLAFRGGPGLLP